MAHRRVLPGDWTCQSCGNNVFARNVECPQCGQPRSNERLRSRNHQRVLPGDWTCQNCGDNVFARNVELSLIHI
eukprot:5562557-Karenia_brevis.AAC.1